MGDALTRHTPRTPTAAAIRARKIGRVARRVRLIAPWIEDSDGAVLKGFAECEVVATELFAKIVREGPLRPDGEARAALAAWRQVRQLSLSYARELGLSAAARIALKASGTQAAMDLAARLATDDDEADAEPKPD